MVRRTLQDSFDVVEDGQNGRCLPSVQVGYFPEMVRKMTAGDVMVMMLGTNDILLVARPEVERTVQRLEAILSFVQETCAGTFLLIAPVCVSDRYPELKTYHDCCVALNTRYLEVAAQLGITAWDASTWGIALGSDGVHFSEEGHLQFGERFMEAWKNQ